MKQRFLYLAFLALLLAAAMTTAHAQGFIDLQARLAKQQYEKTVTAARTRGVAANASPRMKLFVTCSKDADAHAVAAAAREIGAQVRVVKGDFIALEIPYSQLEDLAAIQGVDIVNLPPKVIPRTDVTRRVTQATEVNDGSAPLLPQAYTGKGVIVGIMDAGFDVSHPMFKDKDGNLRIKGFYEPGNDSFGGETVVVHFDDGRTSTLSGSAYSNPQDLLDTLKVKDIDGSHGSFCISAAAGSVMSDVLGISGQPLGGIAPEADIMLCNIHNSSSNNAAWDLVESLYYMGEVSEQTHRPLVVSLSQNTHTGWHDGTSTVSRYLGALSGDGQLNLMLCASNEGGDKMYIHESVKANEPLRLIPYCEHPDKYPNNYVWGGLKTSKNVKMEIGIVNLTEDKEYYRSAMTFNSTGTTLDELGFMFDFADDAQELSREVSFEKRAFKKYMKGGSLQIVCYTNVGHDAEGRPYNYAQVWVECIGIEWTKTENKDGEPQQWGFNIYLTPEEDTDLYAWGDLHMNLKAVRADGTTVDGTGDCSVGDWNTSGKPVTVGSWCANNTVHYENTPAQETSFVPGDVAFFSSYGTDLAGNRHPDVCAPGTNVVAAFNSFDPTMDPSMLYLRKGYDNQFVGQSQQRDYFYGVGSGTSISTPIVAGIVALWLQAAQDMGKKLTCTDIKDIIAHSSDTDAFTQASPERFGSGKINAYKGLLYVLGLDTSIPSLSRQQPQHVTFRVAGDRVYANGAQDGTPAVIYSLQGAKLRETAVQGGAFSTAGLPTGVYAVQLGTLGSTLIRK